MSAAGAARSARARIAAVCGCLLLPAACDERFEFDVPRSSASGASGATGLAPGEMGGVAGGAADDGGAPTTPPLAGTGGGEPRCGAREACPDGLHCAGGECRACAGDADCLDPLLPRCDTNRYRCVACLSATDCPEGFRCDSLANRCLMACAETGDCPPTAHGCNRTRGICYECDEDRECARSELGPFCAPDGSGCVECRENGDCASTLCDPLSGRCVECRDGFDCSSGLCDPGENACLP